MSSLVSVLGRYVDHVRQVLPLKAARGLVGGASIGLVVGLVSGSAPGLPLLVGAIATTATLIEMVTRPIICSLFLSRTPTSVIISFTLRSVVPIALSYSLAGVAAPLLWAYDMKGALLPPLMLLMAFINGHEERDWQV